MPQFDVQDPETGQTLTLTGDTPPTEQELNEIFSQTRAPKAANPQPSSPPVAAASPEPESQGNWLSRWAARQAPLKGAGEAAAELPGKTLQWITAATRAALPSMAEDTDADRGLSEPINKSEEIERTISDPAVVLGKNLQDKAHGITGLTDEERKGVFTGIGAGAVNLAPLVASGPLAPLVMGAESYANHLVNDYTAAKKEGKSDDEAAEIAGNRARASGLTEATIWTVVPKLLKPVFEKYLIDKYGAKWFSNFLTKRAAMAGEVGAASGVSQAGQNVIEGKPVGENVPEAVGSGALMGVFTPGGKTKSEQEAEREMLGPNGETVDPRAVAWAGTFGAAGPQAETANVRAPVRVVPGDYVPPEPGPLRPIPDVRKQPGRLRVQLQSTQLTKDEQDAITQRQESQNDQLQYPGATQGAPVPENEPEVRQVAGEQAGSGDSAQSVGQEKAPDRLTPVESTPALDEKQPVVPEPASASPQVTDAKKDTLPTPGYPYGNFVRSMVEKGYRFAENETDGALSSGGRVYPTLISPDGVRLAVDTTRRFVREGRGVWIGDSSQPMADALHLESLVSAPKQRGRGFASKVMKDAVAAADESQIRLEGEPVAIKGKRGEKGLTTDQLWKWYKTLGFKEKEGSGGLLMERSPVNPSRVEAAQKAAATREAARQPDIIDWVEGNYPKGIKPSNVNEFGAYVDSAKGAARKLLFKTQGEDADKAAKEYTVYSGVETSEEDLLKQIADAGASRQDNEARRKLEDEAAVQAGKFSSAIKRGKFVISPEKLKIGDKVTVDYEPLTVKRIDARNGEVFLQGGDKFGQQVVRFGAKFRAQKFEERPARESRIAGDLFESKPREPAAEKAEEAPATAPAAESGKNSPELSTPPPAEPKTEEPDLFTAPINPESKSPETKAPEEKAKLTTSESKELAGFVKRDRAVRDAKEGAEPLTPVERKRYDDLMAKAGQEEFPIEQSGNQAKAEQVLAEVLKSLPANIRRDVNIKGIKADVEFPATLEGSGGLYRNGRIILEQGEPIDASTVLHEVLHDYILKHPELYDANEFQGMEKAVDKLHASLNEAAAKPEKPAEPGSITPEQAATIEAVQKYRVKGAGPQTWALVEKMEQSVAEKEAGEQPVKVRNDKTGKDEVMLETDLEPVRTRTAAEREATKGMSKKELDEALLKAGMEPSEFPDAASKRAALKRFRAKGGKASLDNEGQGGVRHEDAVAEVERARSKYPDAPPMQIVDRPDWIALGEDGNHYGIKGLWHSGRIWLNKAYVKNAEEARATLEHEIVHPLLETDAGVKAVEDAIASGLGKAKMDALIAKYGDRYVAQEEWFTKLAEEDRGLWKTIVDHVRQFLSKAGLVKLTDEEIGRGIIRMLRDKQSKAVQSGVEPTAKDVTAFGGKANLTDEPVNPEDMNPEDFDREGPAAALAPRTNRHQVAGVKRLGAEYEVENMARIRDQVREQFFNGTAPLNPDNTEMAWNVLQDLVDPAIRDSRAAMVRNQAGGEMAPGMLINELWDYGLRLAFTSKDPSLLRFMVERNADIATMGGSGISAAARAMRAAQDRAVGPLWASLVEITRERARAARQELGVGEDLFNELVGTINSLDVPAEDLERMVLTGTDRAGRPVREVLEDLTPEAREAERILDQYERTQTEWLKPDRQLSIIRQIIRESIKGGPTAKYRDQAEFVNFVSERFQNATVPKDIADRLAFEVWKDKQARESAATSKALRAEETREQRNAESLLDRWAKEQTEWVKLDRKNQVRDIIKEFMGRTVDKGNPERYRAELAQIIRGVGVPENIAREVAFQAWNRKLTFDDARSARALEIERERLAKQAENTAKAMLNRLESRNTEWVKPDQKPGVAKIIADSLRPLSAAEKKELGELAIRRDTPDQKSRYDELKGRDVLPESDVGSFVVPLRDRLVAAGVKADTAYRLAREIYQKRIDDWSAANRRAMDRAAGSGSIRSLIEAIRTSPYRSQMDPAWRIKTASDWFVSNGVERGRADAAAKLFNEQFEKAMGTAAEREARRILRDEEPKRLQDVIAAIRAGLTDPDRNWVDDIAMRKGYKPLTKEQHARIAELEQKFSDPNLSTAERVATTEQIFGVLRHTGYVSGATWRFIAGSYANSLLSGTRTLALHIFQPAASMLLRDIPMHVVTNLHHPGDIVTVGRLLLQAAKSWFPQAKFAWQNDAYTFSAHEMTLRHNELKRQFEIAQGELKSKTAAGIAKGTLRMLYAWQQYVTRALQTANQAGMAITRDIKLALYGSRAMRDFGLSTSEISQMVDVVSDAKRAAYEDGLLRGLDKATAAVVADEKANKALSDFFSNATNDQTAKDILKAAENDAYSIVGRRAPGVNEIDEAFLSRPLVWLMEAATKARSRSGQESMLSIALLGFVNVPLRLARFHMNSGPYALLRWGVDKYRKATNRETFWKQSFANSLQARQRLNEALFGAGLMLAGGLLGSTFHSSDEDASKKKFGVYFTGAGPKSKVLRDAWQKRGFRPYSIQVVVDGKMVNFPLTRVGQVLAQPFVLASTLDDAEWARKEAAASGKDVPQKLSETAALGVGNYYHMVIGDMGFFQSVEQGIRLGRGEKNIGASVLDKITGVAAATVLPGKQLLSNISDWFMGPLDRSSVQSAIAANFPVLGAPWQKKAMNRFGDELYDQTLYGKFQKSGLPFAIRISDTPENEKLYGLLLNKGAAAPDLRRYVIEEKYGPLSDEQWSKFAKTSGDSLKTAVLASSDGLKSASPDEVKKFLVQAGSAANNQAADELALQAKKEPKSGINAASGTPDKASSLFGGGSRGSSSGVSSPSISPTAGATASVGKRSRLRTGASSHRGASGGSRGTSKGRRLVHGSLKPRSGRIRHASLPKSHHRRLSAA